MSPPQMFGEPPPAWSLRRPKPIWQSMWDLIGAPLRMALLPDVINERLHLTSLRAERLGMVLPLLSGRLLDIGAGDNMLVKLHCTYAGDVAANSIGVDVVDWGGDCVIVENCRSLPFEDATFDTVSFIACLNHIPEREAAMREAIRVLRPGGKVVITMIGKFVGDVGHAIWWYSEDKHRDIADGEVMGIDSRDIVRLMEKFRLEHLSHTRFVYQMNHCFVAEKPQMEGV